MDEPQPGPSNTQIPLIKHDTATSEDDSGSIKYADSPDSPPVIDVRKASIAAQQQLHDGIILLITSDTESQRSPNGSIAQHPLSEYYLLPLPQDALSANRRYSLQEKNKQYHPERKASCPDAELGLSPDRGGSSSSRRGSSCSHNRKMSELDIGKDRLTPTSFSSRRSSNASACHSRRSSNCSIHHHGHRSRRSSNCSRRSSNSSRRSSTASHRSSPPSRRSSNCSRRSSHFDSDEESCHHPHHHCHRGSRTSLDPFQRGSADLRRGSSRKDNELDEREELEMGGIPPRHRKIIIWIIGSVSIFILAMSVVLIAVSLTMSPTIDDLGKSIHYINSGRSQSPF